MVCISLLRVPSTILAERCLVQSLNFAHEEIWPLRGSLIHLAERPGTIGLWIPTLVNYLYVLEDFFLVALAGLQKVQQEIMHTWNNQGTEL